MKNITTETRPDGKLCIVIDPAGRYGLSSSKKSEVVSSSDGFADVEGFPGLKLNLNLVVPVKK